MKILYSSAFVCCLLVWFSSPVQVIQAASHNAANTAAIGPSAAEAAVLRAASNAVQAARSIRLTNQVLQAAAAPPAGTRATTTASGSPTAAGVAIRTVSTNALQMVTTVRLQNQLSPAARMTALAAGQSNNRLLSLENGPACVRLGSGLVSWWQAEDDASDSVGSNSGVLANDASFDAGMVGEAFTFNGTNQSVEIPYSATMATPGFTLEAWVKPAGQAEDWLGQAFVFGQSYGRQLVVRAGSQGLAVALQISNDPWTFYEVDSSGEIPIGEWTHLAGTWDGGTLSLYINGTLDQQAAVDTVAWDSGCAFHIGGVYDPEGDCAYVGQFFNGLIDEVSLYDRALFAGEINAIYLAGAAGKCKTAPVCVACPASAVAWWPGQGDASDVFGNSPGVLQNGAGFGVGMTGQAFSFDGINQAVEVSYSSALTSSVFSLEAWVKPVAQIGWQAFVFGQSYGRQLVVRAGSQGLGVAFQISNNRWTFYEVDSSGEIPIGEWTHLVGTWDGAALSLYINGALDQQAPLEAVAWDSGCAFHIGGVYDPEGDCAYEGQFFNGLIDEVTYYNQALSAADVQALYNAGSAGKCGPVIPASWLIHYFGPNYQNEPYAAPDADADGDGVSNLQEYLQGTDPNKIRFFLSLTNQYATTTVVPVQLNILGGVPSYVATLVNDTNTADASWQLFTSSNLWVPTPTDGRYAIAVGLRGLPNDATQTWQSVAVIRDSSPLLLALTNLAAMSGPRPFIDPAGYATRALKATTWSMVDANGKASTGSGVLVARSWNLADQFHTTNWFECVDLPLALGMNQVSIHAVDWAGNVAVTNFAYLFDTNGDITPPALNLRWPQDATLVSGDSFAIQAWMDDDTATAALQYTNSSGLLQTIAGLVERGGNVWVEGVPLAAGTNRFSLLATDAAGNVNTTNFSVVQSSVTLTVNPLSQDQMQYGYATVMVTAGGSPSAVTVNGVPASSSDGESWEADNVPLPPGGTVTLQATAQMADGSTCQTLLEEERDPLVFTQIFDYTVNYTLSAYRSACGTNWTAVRDIPFKWVRGQGCTPTFTYSEFNPCTEDTSTHEDALTWPADNGYLPSLPGQRGFNDYINDQLWHSFTLALGPPLVEWFENSTSSGNWPSNYNATWSQSNDREIRLFTGGKALRQGQGLFDLSASLNYVDCLDTAVSSWCASSYWDEFLWMDSPPVAVPSTNITLGALGPLGPDGHLWTVQPDGIEVVITPQVSSCRSASALASSPIVATGTRGGPPADQKYKLRIYFGSEDVTDTNVDGVVGLGIGLSCSLVSMPGGTPPPITNYLWTIPGTAVSNFYVAPDMSTGTVVTPFPITNATAHFYWVDAGSKAVQCRAIAEGNEMRAKTTFSVARPAIDWIGSITSTVNAGGDDTGRLYVRFGSTTTNELGYVIVLNGIECRSSDPALVGYGGPYDFLAVQLLTGGAVDVTLADGTTTNIPMVGLDNLYPTADLGNGDDGLFADAPGTSARPAIFLADASSYRTLLMFEPVGVDAIPVPIKEILWNYSGQVATNAGGGWIISNCTSNISVNNRDTLVFPYWTNLVKNLSLSP